MIGVKPKDYFSEVGLNMYHSTLNLVSVESNKYNNNQRNTFVICLHHIQFPFRYTSINIEDVDLTCQILNDNSLPAAGVSQLADISQSVQFYDKIGK